MAIFNSYVKLPEGTSPSNHSFLSTGDGGLLGYALVADIKSATPPPQPHGHKSPQPQELLGLLDVSKPTQCPTPLGQMEATEQRSPLRFVFLRA